MLVFQKDNILQIDKVGHCVHILNVFVSINLFEKKRGGGGGINLVYIINRLHRLKAQLITQSEW